MLLSKPKYPLPPEEPMSPLQQENQAFGQQPQGFVDGVAGAVGGTLATGILSKILNSPPEEQPEEVSPETADLPLITKNDLNQASQQKAKLAAMGGIGDALSNQQSWGNFYLGKMNPHQDVSGTFNKLADRADDTIRTKEKLQKEALVAPELRYMKDAINPNSELSKNSVQLHQAMLNKYADNLRNTNPQMSGVFSNAANGLGGRSAFEIQKLMDGQLGKIMSQEDLANTKNQLMKDLKEQMLDTQNKRLGMMASRIGFQQDNQANQVAKDFDNDSLMKQYALQRGQIGKAIGLLNTNEPITTQTASELSTDLATILQNGRAAGLEASNKQEYRSAEGTIAAVKQYWTGHPQDALPARLRAQLKDQFVRLDEAIQTQMGVNAKRLGSGRSFPHNPQAQSILNQKVQQYSKPAGASETPPAQTPEKPAAKQVSQQQIEQWASKHNTTVEEAKKLFQDANYGIH